MGVIRFFRLLLRLAEWATPHVKELHRARHLNRTEGQRHLQARNYAEAEQHFTDALTEKHSRKHQAEILAQLAKAQTKLNKLAEAEQSARAALDLAAESDTQWDAVETLVTIQSTRGDTGAAVATLVSMENREKSQPKPNRPRLAKGARRRGKLLIEAGRSTEGLAVLDEAARIGAQAWGPEDLETAHNLAEIGAIQAQLGNHVEAQNTLGRALKIYKVTEGYNTEEASRSLQNLAMSLEASGNYDGAASEYERFVAAGERQVGYDRAAVMSAKIRLGALYVQAGRSAAARELLTDVIAILERKPDSNLRDALEIMAIAEDDSGRPLEAERWRAKVAQLPA